MNFTIQRNHGLLLMLLGMPSLRNSVCTTVVLIRSRKTLGKQSIDWLVTYRVFYMSRTYWHLGRCGQAEGHSQGRHRVGQHLWSYLQGPHHAIPREGLPLSHPTYQLTLSDSISTQFLACVLIDCNNRLLSVQVLTALPVNVQLSSLALQSV
jgi:hypothetical protein